VGCFVKRENVECFLIKKVENNGDFVKKSEKWGGVFL